MKISVEYKKHTATPIAVKEAYYLGNYALRISFDDGVSREVDFGAFLQKSQHPAIRQYLNEQKFQQFDLVNGNLNWNNYELIFPVADLYQGKII